MMKNILLVAICALSINNVFGQKNLPDNYFMTRLDNGLDVLVVEDKSVPLATLELCVKNGAYTEPPEYDGLSHLYEHMFFKANRDYENQEAFMKRIRQMGAIFNGTTSSERVNYFITVPNKNLKNGLEFLNVAMRYPKFDKKEMIKENPVVDGEFQRAESNPTFFLLNDMDRNLWGDLYSRKNVIGDHHIINTATPEKMNIIKDKFYYPNNTILAVAGDVDHKTVFKMANDIYGDWERSDFDIFTKYPIPEFEPLDYSSRFLTVNENAPVPIMLRSWHGPDTRNDILATYAADVFSYILSQNSSKLTQELIETGLLQNISLGYQTLKHTGPIQLFIVMGDPTKMDAALAKIEEHINMWDSDDYFTDEQLQIAKDQLAVGEAYESERTSNFIHTLTYWWASASIDYYVNYVDNLQKVTREDIKEYVRKYIKGKPSVAGLLVSENMISQFNTNDVFTNTLKPEQCNFTFDKNSASLNAETRQTVNSLSQWMKINPGTEVKVSVYADPTEVLKVKLKPADIASHPDKDNIKKKQPLGNARYLSIVSELAKRGVDINRIRNQVTFQTIN